MNKEISSGVKRVTIHPGGYYASGGNVIISTILGSCVSACLYDPVAKVAGMNHFLLSNKQYDKGVMYYLSEAGRYGINAMELVINRMLKLGAHRENIRAKAFGGSSLLGFKNDQRLTIGEANCNFILEFLENEGIPLVSSDLGGDRGRVIKFSTADFSVQLKRIAKGKTVALVEDEKEFWRRSLAARKNKALKPSLWV